MNYLIDLYGEKMKIKSLFMSDLHLGCKKNNRKKALKVLNKYEFDNLFLLGDIVDIKALTESWEWGGEEDEVWNTIVDIALEKNVVYTTGNHCRGFFDNANPINKMQFVKGYVWGDSYLTHGDYFDTFEHNIWPKELIAIAYSSVSNFNLKIASQVKKMARRMPGYLDHFEKTATAWAQKNGYKSIVLGHTHQQSVKMVNNVMYYNVGDFREDATYMVEHLDGEYEMKEE